MTEKEKIQHKLKKYGLTAVNKAKKKLRTTLEVLM